MYLILYNFPFSLILSSTIALNFPTSVPVFVDNIGDTLKVNGLFKIDRLLIFKPIETPSYALNSTSGT